MSVQWLLKLVLVLGPKLKKAWPHLMHIMEDVQAILVILNEDQVVVIPPSYTERPEKAQLLEACVKELSESESEDALDLYESFDNLDAYIS